MGRTRSCLSALKKVFCLESKEKREKVVTSTEEEKNLTEVENENIDVYSVPLATAEATVIAATEVVRPTNVACYSGKSKEEMVAIKIQTAFRGYMQREPAVETITVTSTEEEKKLTEAENEKNMDVNSVALATIEAADAATTDVVRPTNVACFSGKSKEEMAAIKIQTAFRGYMAKRAFRAQRGLVWLKTMIRWQSVKCQAMVTLKCMQTLVCVQSEVCTRRIRMLENESLLWQLQQKHLKELEKLKVSIVDNWNDSSQLKEQIEAMMQSTQEAAIRRERALAYAHTHQQAWRNTPKYTNQTFMGPNNPHRGQSCLERWMASRPWGPITATEKELNNDNASAKSIANRAVCVREFWRTQSYHDDNKPSPSAQRRNLSHIVHGLLQLLAQKLINGSRKIKVTKYRGSNHGMDDDLQRCIVYTQSTRGGIELQFHP